MVDAMMGELMGRRAEEEGSGKHMYSAAYRPDSGLSTWGGPGGAG